ncbi:ATP synthase F1 subunit epsilon [Pajaroellobacter abortibovis]|uniref:ATP synthase epsilon chain n=1 Tax=Pajaroellobacter abortibovis TaxID=1882918 RepID=A0A1L6MXC5_9BACT|nr:ATP synthase F1 subunit epsilon [Pajaroellobacter abortibovis]APS00152.1 ATP synthase F1 subunit epsilon [Pajaroellobacter abortibovis]
MQVDGKKKENKIQIEILTPHGQTLSVQVDEVTIPSTEGELGLLPGHRPIMAVLKGGIVTYLQEKETKRVSVRGGFARAEDGKLLLMTDNWVQREEIDPVQVRKKLMEIQLKWEQDEHLRGSKGPLSAQEREALMEEHHWLAIQLELHGDPAPPRINSYEEPIPSSVIPQESSTSSEP